MTFAYRRRPLFGVAAFLFTIAPAFGAAEAPPQAVTGALSGHILNDDKTPAAGATVRLYLDVTDAVPRHWRELKSVTTGETGDYAFPDLPKAWYLVAAERDGSARTFRTFVLEAGSDLEHDFVLRKPVRSSLLVRDEAGRPLAGARLRSIGLRDENGEFWLRTRQEWETFTNKIPAPSDETGRIDLPELPEGAVLTEATIDHPDLAPAEVKGAPARPGVIAEAALRPGVAVALKVAGDGRGERPAGAEIRLLRDEIRHPSSIYYHRLPIDAEGAIRFTVEPGRYQLVWLSHEDFHFTPIYSADVRKGESLRVGESGRHEFLFVPRRKVAVRGWVVDAEGDPVSDADIQGEIPNVGPDGRVPEGQDPWAHAGWGKTDANGEYTVSLAAGRARISFYKEGQLPEERYSEFEVSADGPATAPEIRVRAMPKIAGVVQDGQGRPVPGAVVRLRGLLRGMTPTKTDENGRFELSPPSIPADPETEEPRPVQSLVAFHPYERLAARTDVRLDDPDSLEEVVLMLAPHEPGALVDDFREELTPYERGELNEVGRVAERAARTLRGQPAPDLDGTWLNVEPPADGLAAFRGKYVLLDFWFIGCGPCHADFPSVKLLHDLYKDHGLVVIAVHDNSATPETVREFAEKEGMTVPILVDEPDGRTNARYEGRGLSGYPSHILIAPDGTILDDDTTTPSPSLRTYKIELLRELLLGQ